MVRRVITHQTVGLPALLFGGVVFLALVLLTIGARSPYTQANFDWSYDPGYTRSEQTFLGPPLPYAGGRLAVAPSSDPVERGQQLFVSKGCASCHGLAGRDAVFAPAIVGTDANALSKKVYKGPGGMPAYSHDALNDDDLAAIAAYLKAMGKP